MTSLMRTLLRGIATAFAIAVLFTLGTALEAAADCPVPSMTKPSTAPDLVVSNETCKVGMGTYYYASVNILNGGVLWFQDEEDVHFWAKAIIIENGGSVLAGTDQDGNLHPRSTPIGTHGGVVSTHPWGAGPPKPPHPRPRARRAPPNPTGPPPPPR